MKSKLGILKVVKINRVTDETPKNNRNPVKSYSLTIPEIASLAQPGQFAMMWMYDIDEKPMGIASANKKTGEILFAVAKLGKATTSFHQLKTGDLLGIRGPYGNGFTIQGKKIAIIGGGTGIAPSRFLIEEALNQGLEVTLFHGARTENELAFKNYFEELNDNNKLFEYQPSTDDGSYCFEGFATQCFNSWIDQGNKTDAIYTCGPELMMYHAWKLAIKLETPFQASLADRYFKCAIGLCGQCTVDPLGLRLCIDGPVLDKTQLEKISDFGIYGRDKFGMKVSLSDNE